MVPESWVKSSKALNVLSWSEKPPAEPRVGFPPELPDQFFVPRRSTFSFASLDSTFSVFQKSLNDI